MSALTTTLLCRKLAEILSLLTVELWGFFSQHKNNVFTAAGIPAQCTAKGAQGNPLKSAELLQEHGEGQGFIHLSLLSVPPLSQSMGGFGFQPKAFRLPHTQRRKHVCLL